MYWLIYVKERHSTNIYTGEVKFYILINLQQVLSNG